MEGYWNFSRSHPTRAVRLRLGDHALMVHSLRLRLSTNSRATADLSRAPTSRASTTFWHVHKTNTGMEANVREGHRRGARKTWELECGTAGGWLRLLGARWWGGVRCRAPAPWSPLRVAVGECNHGCGVNNIQLCRSMLDELIRSSPVSAAPPHTLFAKKNAPRWSVRPRPRRDSRGPHNRGVWCAYSGSSC